MEVVIGVGSVGGGEGGGRGVVYWVMVDVKPSDMFGVTTGRNDGVSCENMSL